MTMQYELYHHGILGMKWGIRRYQNKDGTLTAAGKKRYLNSDGTLRNKGVQKAKQDYSQQRYSNKGRYEQKTLNEDGKLTEYTIDKDLGAIVSRKVKSEANLLELFDDGVETIKDSDIKKGQLAIEDLKQKKAFDGRVADYLYDRLYESASKEDRRFMDDYPNLVKETNDPTGATDAAGNEMAKLSIAIESKTINYYDSKPVTSEAKSLMKKIDSAYDKWRWSDLPKKERDKAFAEYKKLKQDMVDLCIKDQGYVPSEITRAMFTPLIYWD